MGDISVIKILHVIAGMGSGGAESMIMNWYRNIDRTKVQFDFLLRSQENIYENEIEELGGKVYYMPKFPNHYFSNLIQTEKFFRDHAAEYVAIHVHGNALIYTSVFLFAKRYGVNNRIMHSHNTSTSSIFYKPIHLVNKRRIKHLANHHFACSKEAGKWCFNDDFQVFSNAIDSKKFRYDEQKRKDFRRKMNIASTTIVFCNIGRFLESKNHKFIFKVFEEYHKFNVDSKLLLVGVGPLKDKFEKVANELDLDNDIIFLGVQKDIPSILSASDVFLFPSLYEGNPVALLEAQASGITCLASNTISLESKASDNIRYLSIQESPSFWCDNVELANEREKAYKYLENYGFDIKSVTKKIEEYYLSLK